jgi:hypothetical protein
MATSRPLKIISRPSSLARLPRRLGLTRPPGYRSRRQILRRPFLHRVPGAHIMVSILRVEISTTTELQFHIPLQILIPSYWTKRIKPCLAESACETVLPATNGRFSQWYERRSNRLSMYQQLIFFFFLNRQWPPEEWLVYFMDVCIVCSSSLYTALY